MGVIFTRVQPTCEDIRKVWFIIHKVLKCRFDYSAEPVLKMNCLKCTTIWLLQNVVILVAFDGIHKQVQLADCREQLEQTLLTVTVFESHSKTDTTETARSDPPA